MIIKDFLPQQYVLPFSVCKGFQDFALDFAIFHLERFSFPWWSSLIFPRIIKSITGEIIAYYLLCMAHVWENWMLVVSSRFISIATFYTPRNSVTCLKLGHIVEFSRCIFHFLLGLLYFLDEMNTIKSSHCSVDLPKACKYLFQRSYFMLHIHIDFYWKNAKGFCTFLQYFE